MSGQAVQPSEPSRRARTRGGLSRVRPVGQCGVEKSGNYLLYRLLRTAMERAGTFQSHAARSGCWDSLFALDGGPLSFPEQRDIDEAEVHDHQIYVRNSHLKARFALRDRAAFDRDATLLWTHQPPCDAHRKLLGAERRWLYLIRDGRDVVNSWIHYATSPRMLARHPDYGIDDPGVLYGELDYFIRCVDRWARHVEAYLALADHYTLVRFEDLVGDRAGEILRLVRFAGLEQRVDRVALLTHVDPERTRADAPNHVRHAGTGDWRRWFGPEQQDLYRERTARLLERLAIPEYATW